MILFPYLCFSSDRYPLVVTISHSSSSSFAVGTTHARVPLGIDIKGRLLVYYSLELEIQEPKSHCDPSSFEETGTLINEKLPTSTEVALHSAIQTNTYAITQD